MAEEIASRSDMSAAMTATGMTQITDGSYMTSSSSSSSSSGSIDFYFQCAVVVMGVIGTATNALILYALVASKQHKKHVLIVNQNVLDVFGSFFLTICYSLMLCKVYLNGSTGYWLCTLLLSESPIWCGIIGSTINLATISVERYLKIVHRTWSKKHLRKWMIYSAAAFAWIGSVIYNLAVLFPTAKVIDGVCYAYMFWKDEMAAVANVIVNLVSFYVIIILIFIFCYWRILAVIRHQASVMAGHGTSGGSSYNHIQVSIIKTMVLVSVLYGIMWLPNCICSSLLVFNPNLPLLYSVYYWSVFMVFLYICINPFIYATKLDPVKEVLLRMIPFKKITEQGVGQASENVAPARVGTTSV